MGRSHRNKMATVLVNRAGSDAFRAATLSAMPDWSSRQRVFQVINAPNRMCHGSKKAGRQVAHTENGVLAFDLRLLRDTLAGRSQFLRLCVFERAGYWRHSDDGHRMAFRQVFVLSVTQSGEYRNSDRPDRPVRGSSPASHTEEVYRAVGLAHERREHEFGRYRRLGSTSCGGASLAINRIIGHPRRTFTAQGQDTHPGGDRSRHGCRWPAKAA